MSESEASKENYKDNKFFYNKELVQTSNLIIGITILMVIIFKK